MKNFLETDIEYFENHTFIIDVDGTLTLDKNKDISSSVFNKLIKLKERNNLYLCSNGSWENAKKFAEMSGCSYLVCKKPFTGVFNKILKNIDKERVVVVGDKYLTDGLLAKFLGVKFIKVDHLSCRDDSLVAKLSYILDDIVWAVLPYIRLVRPWQWIKNLLVFAPVFFAVGVLNSSLFSRTLLVFITFCLASSLVYTFNDILDYKQDSLHPKKKNRPIASAEISKKNAILLIFFLAIGIFYLVMLVPSIILPILLYVVINIFYSFKLKHIAVLDIILISLFYILRIIAGGLATEIYVSPWIVVCVFFGSLFVILGKRRAEHTKENRRLVLNDYSSEALNFMLGISASLAIIAYGIWSVTEHNSPYLVYSTIFVVFAIFRILNHIYTNPHEAESPEILVFKDRLILGSFLSWGVYIFWLFYLV